ETKPFPRHDLSGANFVGFWIPSNDRLRSRAAGGGADAQNVVQSILPAVAREAGAQILALAQNLRRQLDQGINFNLLRRLWPWSQRRHKLQGSHAARPSVAKSFDRIKTLWR